MGGQNPLGGMMSDPNFLQNMQNMLGKYRLFSAKE